jgi:hypothetical protein
MKDIINEADIIQNVLYLIFRIRIKDHSYKNILKMMKLFVF